MRVNIVFCFESDFLNSKQFNFISKTFKISILTLFGLCVKIGAQTDSTATDLPDDIEETIENFILDSEASENFDFNDLTDEFEYLQRRPLNLNRADYDALDFGLLSPTQIQDFLNYRRKNGDLISIYELQAIPTFSLETIRNLLPFVRVREASEYEKFDLKKLWSEKRSELLIRWERLLDLPRGFDRERDNGYLGDPNRLFVRYRMNAGENIRLGFTAEKDRGEEFFKGSNKEGFDFYSFHAFAKNISPVIKSVALGDFTASFGQGLILQNGFAQAKNAQVLNIKRRNSPLKAYSSVNEELFFRGAGTNLKLGKNLDFTAFGSVRQIDGNISIDTISAGVFDIVFSSFLESGMHRTANEIEDENSTQKITTGGRLNYKKRNFQLAINSVYDKLDKPLQGISAPYNLFRFSGEELFNGSVDYSYYAGNLHFFGETGIDSEADIATTNGLLLGLGKYASASFLYRNFAKDFQSLNGQPFSETRLPQNEQGFYSGISLRPVKNWKIDAYYDFWKHPWLRFGIDSPSGGNEWFLKIEYKIRKRFEVYAQFRGENKQRNFAENETKTDFLNLNQRQYYRLNWKYQFSKFIEWRSRFEISQTERSEVESDGFLIYQDLLWKFPDAGFSFKTRLAFYSTKDFNSRIFTYENDVLNSFSVPSFFGQGTRFYLYARYKIRRGLDIEGRYARTFRRGDEGMGSGLELIEGNFRNELKFQLGWKF